MSEIREEFEELEPAFKVEDDQTAEWCMQQIRNAQEEKEKWKAFYDDRYAKVCETCDLTITNMNVMLQMYFANVPHKKTATQENYALPSGKLVMKKQEPEFVRDDEELIAWLKKNGGEKFIKTKEVLDWAGLKKTLNVMGDVVADEQGQIIPCMKANEREDVFKVELKKGEKS